MRTKSETSQTEPPTHTTQQLEQRRRLCEIVSAPGTPTGETLQELRRLQDALRGVFSDEGWKQSGVMLVYPFGG